MMSALRICIRTRKYLVHLVSSCPYALTVPLSIDEVIRGGSGLVLLAHMEKFCPNERGTSEEALP